ncbi:putative tRNA isopentenyltransferase [Trypanosoma rangeli]|uniref:Putative tRNA isopentenyltransferase n=1 Tax=Trypanosoma rangeli TaxID=5698 RepID=A0A3R7MK94_TRYRA|nr:putative tRNA isopentenyltransferase [Trypanosoma rangeli]RNF04043.1 putative tRNA isopentenyltransferase [Trypanosoma rangeli]|eukprot:RNF04043.1 putative tRNA isopentenyltransferase [Trypanosoma rangeli]
MATEGEQCSKPIFFVLGATGSGKSLAAVNVAKTLQHRCGIMHVTIVNCDVMQFYADLPIATNKVASSEMEDIPHCFIGFLSPSGVKIRDPTVPYKGVDKTESVYMDISEERDVYNVHSYVRDVVAFIKSFFREHSSAAIVVCGGTCYYAQALLFDNTLTLEDEKGFVDEVAMLDFSTSLENVEGKGLWQELNRVDPVIAVRYHPNDTRRISRLLEIYKKSGRLPSEIYATRPDPCFRFSPKNCFILWIRVPYEALKIKLDERVDKMVERGIVEEFVQFAKRNNNINDVGLAKAIGFKEFISAFAMINGQMRVKGECALKNSIDLLRSNTKRYARQQEQWIRNRLLGRLRFVFTSLQGTGNFIAIDALKMLSEFIEMVQNATEFLLKQNLQMIQGVTLPLNEIKDPPSAVKQEWCEVCEIFVCGGNQMRTHITSKRHRGAVRHAALVKEQEEKYGRVISRKKQRMS